jgi:hypothetical protein
VYADAHVEFFSDGEHSRDVFMELATIQLRGDDVDELIASSDDVQSIDPFGEGTRVRGICPICGQPSQDPLNHIPDQEGHVDVP